MSLLIIHLLFPMPAQYMLKYSLNCAHSRSTTMDDTLVTKPLKYSLKTSPMVNESVAISSKDAKIEKSCFIVFGYYCHFQLAI